MSKMLTNGARREYVDGIAKIAVDFIRRIQGSVEGVDVIVLN
jgi:hypothetical protein